MEMLEAAKNRGSGGALSLEGKNQPRVLFHAPLFHLVWKGMLPPWGGADPNPTQGNQGYLGTSLVPLAP